MLPNKKYIFSILKKRPPKQYATRNKKLSYWNDFKPFSKSSRTELYINTKIDGLKIKYDYLTITFDKRKI